MAKDVHLPKNAHSNCYWKHSRSNYTAFCSWFHPEISPARRNWEWNLYNNVEFLCNRRSCYDFVGLGIRFKYFPCSILFMKKLILWISLLILVIVISGCISEKAKKTEETRTEVRAKVAAGTEIVAFAIQGRGIEDLNKTGPNLGIDSDGSDGWNYLFDSLTYPNGVYTIYTIAGVLKNDTPPLGGVTAQVIIQN